jgi:D-alanine transaminase
MIVYLNGQYLPLEQAHISPMDRGFLYGDAVYEVIRVYHGQCFRLGEHFERLCDSLAKMRMDCYTQPLEEVPKRLLAENGLGGQDALVYLQITRGTAPRRHHFFPDPDETRATVYGMAWKFTPNPVWTDPGMTVITLSDDRWARCDIKTTALVPNVLGNQRAKEEGAHEGIYIRDGALTEGTLSNVWAVFEGEVRTPPLSNHILPGIKRQLTLALCREAGIPARETPIFANELRFAEELFITSTPYDVAPIHVIDGRQMPAERPVTKKIMRLFAEKVARETGD